jgi:hypothetical protein
MICPNWSIKAEYLHVDLGKHAVFNDAIPAFPDARNFCSECPVHDRHCPRRPQLQIRLGDADRTALRPPLRARGQPSEKKQSRPKSLAAEYTGRKIPARRCGF